MRKYIQAIYEFFEDLPEWAMCIIYMFAGVAIVTVLVFSIVAPIYLAIARQSMAYLLWLCLPIGALSGLGAYFELS